MGVFAIAINKIVQLFKLAINDAGDELAINDAGDILDL